jgi:hypothetical protein
MASTDAVGNVTGRYLEVRSRPDYFLLVQGAFREDGGSDHGSGTWH